MLGYPFWIVPRKTGCPPREFHGRFAYRSEFARRDKQWPGRRRGHAAVRNGRKRWVFAEAVHREGTPQATRPDVRKQRRRITLGTRR